MRFFEPRILGPNFGPIFADKRAPSKIHSQEFTAQSSHRKIHPRIRAEKFTLHFCRAILLTFLWVFWICQVVIGLSGKGQKRKIKGGKGRKKPIPRKGGQTPLKPPFVTPPLRPPNVFLNNLFCLVAPYRATAILSLRYPILRDTL